MTLRLSRTLEDNSVAYLNKNEEFQYRIRVCILHLLTKVKASKTFLLVFFQKFLLNDIEVIKDIERNITVSLTSLNITVSLTSLKMRNFKSTLNNGKPVLTSEFKSPKFIFLLIKEDCSYKTLFINIVNSNVLALI